MATYETVEDETRSEIEQDLLRFVGTRTIHDTYGVPIPVINAIRERLQQQGRSLLEAGRIAESGMAVY